MECIKTVGWWIFKTRVVRHNFKPIGVWKFMFSSTSYHVNYKCESCGITEERAFVTKDELLLMGCLPSKIEGIGTFWKDFDKLLKE